MQILRVLVCVREGILVLGSGIWSEVHWSWNIRQAGPTEGGVGEKFNLPHQKSFAAGQDDFFYFSIFCESCSVKKIQLVIHLVTVILQLFESVFVLFRSVLYSLNNVLVTLLTLSPRWPFYTLIAWLVGSRSLQILPFFLFLLFFPSPPIFQFKCLRWIELCIEHDRVRSTNDEK